jgi:hypothetical protein
MAYIKYEVDVTHSMYADYERLRKDYVGKKLRKETAMTVLDLIGLPSASPKVVALAIKYGILQTGGQRRGTYYMVPKDIIPYSCFEKLEKEFYQGRRVKKTPDRPVPPKETETGRVVLNEEFCLKYLKERGYMCFKLTPNLLKLQQVFTPQFLLENTDAELK